MVFFRPMTQNFGKSGRAGKKWFTYQIDKLFFLGFEKVKKKQAGVINKIYCQALDLF